MSLNDNVVLGEEKKKKTVWANLIWHSPVQRGSAQRKGTAVISYSAAGSPAW